MTFTLWAECDGALGCSCAETQTLYLKLREEWKATHSKKRIQHGTRAGYQAHRKRGERACLSCSAANREYQKTYNKQRSRHGAA